MDKNKLVIDYIQATNTHNFMNLIPLIDEHAVYQFTDKTCHGIQEVQAYFENAWDMIKDEVYSATDIDLIISDDNTKVYIYKYHYEGYYNGEFIKGSGKATNVFIKSDTQWLLKLEHLNSFNS